MLQAAIARKRAHPACTSSGTFSNVPADSIHRVALEARIRTGFGAHFGACVEGFMPVLARYRHRTGAKGVIGLRRASDETLFLESYLDAPIDSAIAQLEERPVARSSIVEIGQFVVDNRDIVADFFLDLVPYLAEQGFGWACFTATSRIRRIVSRLGLVVEPLANADRSRLGEKSSLWGSYYDQDPVVVAGRLADPFGQCASSESNGRIG